ncbi:MAG: nucleotidyl transferase AbiEii/AbiGii toxin family protein [Pseudonocardiaceae bacterium]
MPTSHSCFTRAHSRYGTYPIETVVAEKLATMMALGEVNTRDRDWADLWRLTDPHDMSGEALRAALVRTAAYRGSSLRPLSEVMVRLPQTATGLLHGVAAQPDSGEGVSRTGGVSVRHGWSPDGGHEAHVCGLAGSGATRRDGERQRSMVLHRGTRSESSALGSSMLSFAHWSTTCAARSAA